MWRYRRHDDPPPPDVDAPQAMADDQWAARHQHLWDALGTVTADVMLVRGMREQSVVEDADETELLRHVDDNSVWSASPSRWKSNS